VKVPVSGHMSLMNISGSSGVTNAWLGNSPPPGGIIAAGQPPPQTQSKDELASGKSKKKGKQKQTLFTFGSIPT